MIRNAYFTSESVTEGHPDKVCDQIADAVLDAIIAAEPSAHVACEVAAGNGVLMIMGETSAKHMPDYISIARRTIEEIGYGSPESGFDLSRCGFVTAMNQQSPDIQLGVNQSQEKKAGASDAGDVLGAGDQGMMVGFACDETPELMPLPISLAHTLTKRLAEVRKSGKLPWLLPDGKSQVTIRYDEKGRPAYCEAVVISAQHRDVLSQSELQKEIKKHVIDAVMPPHLMKPDTKIFINPTGRFVVGGPQGDSGLTGRKIMADTYGGLASHGGGSFSGKDPTKVDRTGAYMARYIAKNVVASGLASRCTVQLAYIIGVAKPVSVYLDTEGTGVLPDEVLAVIVETCFDMRPSGMISKLDLWRPIYRQVASYGHFGRPELDLPWEKTDMAHILSTFKKIR